MLNRLQAALLEHDFVVQYKKGTTMPAYPDFHHFLKKHKMK